MISLVLLYILTHHILCGYCATKWDIWFTHIFYWNSILSCLDIQKIDYTQLEDMTFYIQLGNILLIFRNVMKRNTLRVTFWLNLSSFIFFVHTIACHKLAVSLLNVWSAAKRCLWQGPVMSLITNIAFDKYILWHEFMSLSG